MSIQRFENPMIHRFQIPSSEDFVHFQLFISGNEKGLAYLHRLLYRSTFSFASHLLKDNFEIDCIVQDAFLFAWERRERIENLNHFCSSIKLFIKRRCSRYRVNNWRKNSLLMDFYYTEHISRYGHDPETEFADRVDKGSTKELLKLLENAMPYLPATRKNFLELHHKGLSHQKISKHLGVSCQKVTWEMRKSNRLLKLILPTLHKAHQASQRTASIPVANYEAYLNKQQAQFCTLYYKNKLSFGLISEELGLAPFELLKLHYSAMNILNRIRKK